MTLRFPGEADDLQLVLVLGGGNALGAFQAGFYEGLHTCGFEANWIVGTSIGAINGALIAGSVSGDPLTSLDRFWRVPPQAVDPWGFGTSVWQRTFGPNFTTTFGRPGIFGVATSGMADLAVYDTGDLVKTLEREVDFERLNANERRFTVNAVDLETGEDVVFDSQDGRVGAEHIRASAALPFFFPPVEIHGQWLVDGGMSANLALDPFFARPPTQRTLCIAVDLLPLAQIRPRTLSEAGSRMQDLLFAVQSRRSIERWTHAYANHEEPGITFVKVSYDNQEEEVVGKALDFSAATVQDRWRKGKTKAEDLIDNLRRGDLPMAKTGLTVHDGPPHSK